MSHCSVGVDSTRVAAEFTALVGQPAHGVSLDFVTAASPTAQPTSSVTLKQGPKALLALDSVPGAGGTRWSILEAGPGFRGVQKADVASTDGVTFTGAVDGRDVVPFQQAGLGDARLRGRPVAPHRQAESLRGGSVPRFSRS